MQANECERVEVLENKVAVACRVHRIGGWRRESEFTRRDGPIERKSGTGHRSRSQRTEIQACRAIEEAIGIAQCHLNISKQPMRYQNRLRPLQMRVARHDGFACVAPLRNQSGGPGCEPADDKLDLSAHIKAQVRCNLLIAAAARVQFEREIADALDELKLNEVMNVFGSGMIAHLDSAGVRTEFRGNLVERCRQLDGFALGEDPCRGEGRRVRFAGGDFLIEKAPIKDDGALPGFEFRVQRLTKPA